MTAQPQDDGGHSSNQLAPKVLKGHLLRLRRGVYVEARSWIHAPLWQKYQAAIAAAAKVADPVFCRETALLLHNVPLARVPSAVMARTLRPGGAGISQPAPLTGSLSVDQFRALYRGDSAMRGVHPSRLRNIPTKYLHPALKRDQTRTEARELIRSGLQELHETRIRPPDEVRGCGAANFRVEPLGLALVDTVSRIPFEDAVVALDWVKAHGAGDLTPWVDYLSTGRRQRLWDQAWNFANPLSESPGESRSRAIIHCQGFHAPSLQQEIPTDRGTSRVDFCWEDDAVVGEFDGKSKYVDDQMLNGQDPREAVFEEKQREDALRRAGWSVVRWTWADLNKQECLAQYLARAGVSRRS